jgi:pantoate--beta-alanine ligase
MAFPTSENFHIIPTTRDAVDSLALSSRNAYLNEVERKHAPVLIKALTAARDLHSKSASCSGARLIEVAEEAIAQHVIAAKADGVEMRLDYVEVFDKTSFRPLRGELKAKEDGEPASEAVICGAVWVGKTRLIDNLLMGWTI